MQSGDRVTFFIPYWLSPGGCSVINSLTKNFSFMFCDNLVVYVDLAAMFTCTDRMAYQQCCTDDDGF